MIWRVILDTSITFYIHGNTFSNDSIKKAQSTDVL